MTIPITLPVERLDARFDALIPAGAVADVLADLSDVEGPHWLEGPAWDSRNHCLLFSDVKANAIYRWDRRDGLRLFICGRAATPGRNPRRWRSRIPTASPLIVRADC
jgi:hypothetical protein